MKDVKYWIGLFSRLSRIDKEERKVICEVVDVAIDDCRDMLEFIEKDKIDSVRNYLLWLNTLKNNIKFAEEKQEEFIKAKKQADTQITSRLRKLFATNKDEKPMDRLNRLRNDMVLSPAKEE